MSEKPSNTLTLPLHESPPALLLDENLSSSDIATFLRRIRTEWQIELCIDYLPRGAPDPDVINECGRREWVLISCDDRIRYVPENKAAAIRNRLKAFMFNKGNYQGVEYAAALIVGRSQLLNMVKNTVGPFFARIQRGGDVLLLEPKAASPATSSREKTARKYGNQVFERDA